MKERKTSKPIKRQLASASSSGAKFIKVSKSFMNLSVLNNTSINCPGWLVQFNTSSLVFTEINNLNMQHDLLIANQTDCHFVDGALNEINGGALTDLEYFAGDINNFQLGGDPFFYISKDELMGMDSTANTYYINIIALDYGPSAIENNISSNDPNASVNNTSSNDPYASQNIYPCLKIEADRIIPLGTILSFPSSSTPIQARYILGTPCPPEWKPAFSIHFPTTTTYVNEPLT
jgi:hypothetical protein